MRDVAAGKRSDVTSISRARGSAMGGRGEGGEGGGEKKKRIRPCSSLTASSKARRGEVSREASLCRLFVVVSSRGARAGRRARCKGNVLLDTALAFARVPTSRVYRTCARVPLRRQYAARLYGTEEIVGTTPPLLPRALCLTSERGC